MVCFTIQDKERLDYLKNHDKINRNPENYERCVARERWQEIEYYSGINKAIFWNREKRIFTDIDFNPIEVNEKILPRCELAADYPKLAQDAIQLGIPLSTYPYEFHAIENWMMILPRNFLKRNIIVTTKGEASKEFNHYYRLIKDPQGRFFIKSVVKSWSYSGSREGWYDGGIAMALEHGGAEDLVMFSNFVEINEDERDTIEYRCFIIDGKVKSMSRYLDYENPPPSQDAVDFINSFVKKTVGFYFPKDVVLDIMQLKDGSWDFIEANAIPYSGRYCGNSVEMFK